jgi:5-methylcytosine-specific restriction endonuclease McrBC regulatory subunit McrC
MQDANIIEITAQDCSPFGEQYPSVMQFLLANPDLYRAFRLTAKETVEEELPIARYDYRQNKWCAGRMVGSTEFEHEGQQYRLTITPRFGNGFLIHLLEEIYNIRFLEAERESLQQGASIRPLLQKLIGILWLRLLGNANRYGIPRRKITRMHQGTSIRGQFDVRASFRTAVTSATLVSTYRERETNPVIASILGRALSILRANDNLPSIPNENTVRSGLADLARTQVQGEFLKARHYQSLRYGSTDLNWKPLVDLSWLIIKHNPFRNQHSPSGKSFVSFLDIAEIWEAYLCSILRRHFAPLGWSVKSEEVQTYPGKAFQRKLIPDIVLRHKDGKRVAIFDAKYKQMLFRHYDYDRADFFQIHTYVSYYQAQGLKVVASGLLYPLSSPFTPDRQKSNYSPTLFGSRVGDIPFLVDGVVCTGNLHQESKSLISRLEAICPILKPQPIREPDELPISAHESRGLEE